MLAHTPSSENIFIDLHEIPSIQQSENSIHSLEAPEMRMIKSSKGRDKLSFDGFIYNFQRESNDKKQWRCEVKSCKARLHTTGFNVLKKLGEHSYSVEIGKEEVFEFRAGVKRRARETNDNPHRIIAEVAKTLLPSEKSLKKICHRARPAPVNPTSLCDLIMDENFQTLGGKRFLLYDSGPELDRILMFGTEENKNILSYSTIWMADGTFKTVPSLCKQLYTIHGLVGGVYPFREGHLLPYIYVLLPGKSAFHYNKMWQVIKQLCPDSNPQYLLVDFEQAVINAFKKIWPMTYIKGCFFHLSQSAYRKVQELGLQSRYLSDPEFSVWIRMLPTLAYLPPQFVLSTFETLKMQFPVEALPLHSYFENTYVGRRDEFGNNIQPLFPIQMWNNFHLVAYGIPTTTNAVEAWHRAFRVTVACHHPTFWKFCDSLIIEQASVELRQAQYYTGKPPKESKKSLENESTLVHLVMNYFTRPVITYLRSIAFKFSM